MAMPMMATIVAQIYQNQWWCWCWCLYRVSHGKSWKIRTAQLRRGRRWKRRRLSCSYRLSATITICNLFYLILLPHKMIFHVDKMNNKSKNKEAPVECNEIQTCFSFNRFTFDIHLSVLPTQINAIRNKYHMTTGMNGGGGGGGLVPNHTERKWERRVRIKLC